MMMREYLADVSPDLRGRSELVVELVVGEHQAGQNP